MKRNFFIISLLLALLVSVKTEAEEKIPSPVGWVNDFAGVIDSEYRNKIERIIEEIERATSVEIAVATFQSIAPYDEASYARLVFDNWKIGKKDKDNGVLILIAVTERRWRIETGYGLEGILPDGLCGEIGRNHMVPYFRQGRYGEGIYNAVIAISRIIAKDANVSLGSLEGVRLEKYREPVSVSMYFFALIFFFLWNLPWPFIIGLPFTLIFAFAFYQMSPILGILVIIGYIGSLVVRYRYWSKLPPKKRSSFFGTQSYGGTSGGGGGFGGFGGGGGGGFGGFGGGGGGGGGAGGGW